MVQLKGHALLKGDYIEIIKKNSLFKTSGPISTKFSTKHPWVDGIQIFTKRPNPSSRWDNSKIIKIFGEYLKKIYFRTTGPVSTKLGIKHPWIEDIQSFIFK